MKMPKEIKQKWLAALRSGNYKQGRAILKHPGTGSYCCLGVLQDVCDGEVERRGDGQPRGFPTNLWLKAHDIYADQGEVEELATMNDGEGLSFGSIADYIEESVSVSD